MVKIDILTGHEETGTLHCILKIIFHCIFIEKPCSFSKLVQFILKVYRTVYSLVQDGYPSQVKNYTFGWISGPLELDRFSIQVIYYDLDGFSIHKNGILLDGFAILKHLIEGGKSVLSQSAYVCMTIITKILTMANSLCHIKFVWSIKGYHIFRVRPHPNIELQLMPDPTNPYDNNAMKVMVPILTEIPEHLQLDPSVRQTAGKLQ